MADLLSEYSKKVNPFSGSSGSAGSADSSGSSGSSDNPYLYSYGDISYDRSSLYDGLTADQKKSLDSNPYLNFEYNKTGWQDLASSLGFRTGYDAAAEDMYNQARMWDSEQLERFREEKYNSTEESVAREKAAGLNPDLTGASADNSASEAPTRTQLPSRQGSDVGGFLDGISKVATSLFGFGSSLQKMKALSLANQSSELDLVDKLFNVSDHATTQFMDKKPELLFDENGFPIVDNYYFTHLPVSSKTRKNLEHYYSQTLSGLRAQRNYYENESKKEGFRKDFLSFKSSPMYQDSDDEYRKCLNIFSTASTNALFSGFNRDIERNQYSERYYKRSNSLENGEHLAEFENQDYITRKSSSKYEYELNDVKRDLVHRLKKEADSGNSLASIALLGINAISDIGVPNFKKFGL